MKLSSVILRCLAGCLIPSFSHAALTSVYRFDESTGSTTADDIRGVPGAGSLNGGTSFVAGKIGNAVNLNGTSSYIAALNAVPTGTTAYSVSVWVWADTNAEFGTIVKNWGVSSAGSFHLGFDWSTQRVSNYLSAGSPAMAGNVLSLNAWNHIAITYGSSLQTLYINGSAVSTAAGPASLTALGALMGIGVKLNDNQTGPAPYYQGYWDGKIDDLAFWDNTLTAGEVFAIKSNGDLGIGVSIPEPASIAFLGLAALGLLRRRR